MVFQAAIRKARQLVDQPPLSWQDWGAWEPGHALGPYWQLKKEFLPQAPPPPAVPGAAPGAAHGAAPGVAPGPSTWIYYDLKPGDRNYVDWVSGTPFTMSTLASGGWWTEGWWQASDGSWRYRGYRLS